MARRKKPEEHVNHERWLVSYADFITLLFAFFVVMYAISSVNEGKYRVLSDTLEAVFTERTFSNDPIQVGEIARGTGEKSPDPGSTPKPLNVIELPTAPPPPVSEETIQSINELSKKLNAALFSQIENEDIIIKQGDDWLEIEIKSKVLFGSGEARLENSAIPVIGKVAEIVGGSANPIQVEGFTDNDPINTPRFPSNWELSAARAASVVHLLDRYGVVPNRMSAIGYGEYKPVADNDTEEGRQKNRRVVLVILGGKDSRRTLDIFDGQAPVESEPTSMQATDFLPDTTVSDIPRNDSSSPTQGSIQQPDFPPQ
ncbi:MAG: flagellar motor protein MotD [Gammaproteobacteria bacterium]|nr:flagellar motor protein MotD [Gammaproteobacteria bacterium]